MKQQDSLDQDKLMGADLVSFAKAESGTLRVIVELDQIERVTPPRVHLHLARKNMRPEKSVALHATSDPSLPMKMLESELLLLNPKADLVRLDFAQAYALTVTPAVLRAITLLPHVGVVRSRKTHRTDR